MKLNAANRSTLNAIAVVVILLVVLMFMGTPSVKKSMYQPREITVAPVSEQPLFALPRSTECLAGPTEEADFYNIDVQGICGGQKLVADHASYEISDGIGGVLI